jgi:hypothetical protein
MPKSGCGAAVRTPILVMISGMRMTSLRSDIFIALLIRGQRVPACAVRRRIALYVLVSLLQVTGTASADDTSATPPAEPAAWRRWLDPRTAPFIPIPEVGTDPNSGTTIGILPVWLGTNGQREIERIVAPDLIYNSYLGYGARMRYYAYPADDTQWYLVVGGKQRIDKELDLTYSTGRLRRSTWSIFTRLEYDKSGTQRFYGLGNRSARSAESNYTRELASLNLQIGWNITPQLQLAWETRPRSWRVGSGAIDTLPDARDSFPEQNGFEQEFEWHNRLVLKYDTRDSLNVPSRGSQFVLFAGFADRALLSTVSYAYFGFDARHYQPLTPSTLLAMHLTLRYTPTSDRAPFWALSRLGGDRSLSAERQALRGYGEDRFIDRNMLAFNLELRSQVLNMDLFSTRVTFELAPFLDAGQVFHELDANPFGDLHWVGGVGIRGIAKPYVVGYLDAGYGAEGLAIFSGIDYPF